MKIGELRAASGKSWMLKNFSTVLLAASFSLGTAWAADPPAKAAARTHADNGVDSPQLEVIDVPTPDVLDPATYSTNFRLYSDGGIVSRLIIGPFRRVNFGIMADAQKVIGGSAPHLVRPSLYFKLRVFDGNDVLPALALGYDNEG